MREKAREFFDLSAPERFAYLCRNPEPIALLKHFCNSVNPGVSINQERRESCVSVLLIGAYERRELPAGRFNAPAFGLQRLSSFLRAAGIDVDVFDITSKGEECLIKLLKARNYDFIGFSVLSPTLPNDIQLTHKIRVLCPRSVLIAGGCVPTSRPDLLIESAVDYLVIGYGEDPLLNLLISIYCGLSDAGIPGVLKRSETGHFIGSYALEPTYFDLRAYSYILDPTIGFDIDYSPSSGLYTNFPSSRTKVFRLIAQSRCPRSCVFCSTRNFLKLSCGKSPQRCLSLTAEDRIKVIENILRKLLWVETIFINDDDFFTDKQIAEGFFLMVIRKKRAGAIRDVNFILSARIDELSDSMLSLAKDAGTIVINLGIESFDQKGLESLNKKVVYGDMGAESFIFGGINMVLKNGIIPSANVILFYPETDWNQIYRSVRGAIRLIGAGGEVNLTTYVRVYHGADILDDKTIPRLAYAEPIVNIVRKEYSSVFVHDRILLPRNKKMRIFAEKVVLRKAAIEDQIKRRYSWSYSRVPHKLVQLVYLQALIEEGKQCGYISDEQADMDIRRVVEFIGNEFEIRGFQVREEEDPGFPILHISEDDRKGALEIKRALEALRLEKNVIKMFFELRTVPFCNLFDVYPVIRPYLVYSFLGEEKVKFSHLDEIDKYVLVKAMMGTVNGLNEQQKKGIQEAFGIKDVSEIIIKLRLLVNRDIWYGPDLQSDYSKQIRVLIRNVLPD